jgi:hypothetical protein
VPKSRKERQAGKKKKKYLSKDRKKQLLAIFLVFIMVGSALVLLVSY